MNSVESEMRLVVSKCRGYIKDYYSNDVASEVHASTSWKVGRTMFVVISSLTGPLKNE